MSSLTVIGAGAWGTALAIHAARKGHDVTLWGRAAGRVPARLPGINIPETINLTTILPQTNHPSLIAVPTQTLREILQKLPQDAPILLCCKGIETGTTRLPLEILAEVHPQAQGAVLTGPNFAHEIAAGQPAASVIASPDAATRALFISLLATPSFRLYGNDDAVGAQLGGAAKNVIAIAAGAVIGAGLGENARAALITRGLAELSRLIAAEGGRAETAAGLSGLGDLVLTCTGPGSRNFAYGLALAQGQPSFAPGAPMVEGPVVEGIATAASLHARAANIDLPICHAVADLLAGRLTLHAAVAKILARRVPAVEKQGRIF